MIPIHDPFDILDDPALPSIKGALEPHQAQIWLHQVMGRSVDLQRIEVVRHKPGKRCLIEYHLADLVVLGKVRAKGLDLKTYYVHEALWQQAFSVQAPDFISVPEPLGVVPDLHMTLQRKVGGRPLTTLLGEPDGVELVGRVAEVAHKLHQCGVPTPRHHTMADELRVLRESLALVAQAYPRWKARLEKLIETCHHLAASVPPFKPTGIHRDFYPDQILVDGQQLWLLDLDLYSLGDPALDIGNFIGHLTELALRTMGDPQALQAQEAALEERFVELTTIITPYSVRVYALLTLVRHLWISTRIPQRRDITERLLLLCEERLLFKSLAI